MKYFMILFVVLIGCAKDTKKPKGKPDVMTGITISRGQVATISTDNSTPYTISTTSTDDSNIYTLAPSQNTIAFVAKPFTIDDLRREAKKRHLRWKVFCAGGSPDWQFQGWAIQPSAEFKAYAEDGAKPDWNSHGATQLETAQRLYVAIQGAPDPVVHYAPKHKICPPELHGN